MASNKSRIPTVPQANRPKLLPKPSIKRSSSEELSGRNSKRQVVSSHIRDGSEDPGEIFRPWRSLSNPLDNANEENEEIAESEKLKKWAAACVVAYGAYAVALASVVCLNDYVDRPLSRDGEMDIHRQYFLNRLTQQKEQDCRNELCMGKEAFARLVCILRDSGRLRDTCFSTVEEHVARFLHIIGHNRRSYSAKLDYWCFGETVSKNFHKV